MKTKDEVDYSRGMNDHRCRNCVNFQPVTHTCSKVKGKIDPSYWCKLFKKKGGK